ncbi:MAG: exo-alpha-sialidase [Candidatus Sumerlaeia bacterium]|nr:exo-alpha-sialidase [Candidatus Sumerlaeia bacterium]
MKAFARARPALHSLGIVLVFCAGGAFAALAEQFRIESEQNIFEPESGPWSGSHAATIVQTTDGTIIAGWRRDIDRVSNNEAWMSTYENGRWTLPRILATGSESGDDFTLENVVLFQPKGAPLMLFYYVGPQSYLERKDMMKPRANMWGVVRHSTDNGRTWSPPRPLGEDPRIVGGKLCGPTKNPPIQLPDGTILIPSSNEPALKTAERETPDLTWHFEKSSDLGKTFSLVQVLPRSPLRPIQPGFLVLGGGKLIALGRNEGKGSDTPMATSNDWGATWSDITGLAALPQSHSGICPRTLSDGTHICILNTPVNPKIPRDQLDLMVSTNGLDWKLGLTLNPAGDGKVAHYPQAIQAADGKIHVVFSYGNQAGAKDWRKNVIRHIVLTTESESRRASPQKPSASKTAPKPG